MLTDQFQFQPDAIIRINGVVYAVFFDTGEELGDFPILAKVDSMNFVKNPNAIQDLTDEEFASQYGYVFRGHEDLLVSDIPTLKPGQEGVEYRGIMDIAEAQFEAKAKEDGMSWLLDRDVQTKFLVAVLTGQPVSVSDLKDTNWYNSSTEYERNFMAEYYSDPTGVNEKVQANIADIRNTMFEYRFKGDTNDLARILAWGVVSGKYTADQVDLYLNYIADGTFLEISGGEQLLPEELRGYVDTFETTVGENTARSKVKSWLGDETLASYEKDGTLLRYAGLIRNGQSAYVDEELQTLHDNLYPAFKGSKFSTWNNIFSRRASSTIYGTTGSQVSDLTTKDQKKINDLIIKSNGNYDEFDKLVRKEYVNSPGVKNDIISNLLARLPQAVSGVY